LTSPSSARAAFTTMDKTGVVIPVYGEDDSICLLLGAFPRGLVDTICVVVDAPDAQLMPRLREAALQARTRVHIIKNARRTGIGHSVRQGLEYLATSGHTFVIIMAGNGKDDPREIGRLLDPLASGESDYVQGSRYLPGGGSSNMPQTRVIFNRLYPFLWTLLVGRKCTDVTNGFRGYRMEILHDHRIDLHQAWLDGYALEYYLHYKAIALGYRVKEVPTTKSYPFGHEGGYSKIQPLKDWWPILSPLILLFFGVRR